MGHYTKCFKAQEMSIFRSLVLNLHSICNKNILQTCLSAVNDDRTFVLSGVSCWQFFKPHITPSLSIWKGRNTRFCFIFFVTHSLAKVMGLVIACKSQDHSNRRPVAQDSSFQWIIIVGRHHRVTIRLQQYSNEFSLLSFSSL